MVKRIGDKLIFTYIGLEKAMAKYKPYDYSQRVMISVSLEEQLVPGTLGFAIQTLVEDRMDMAGFEDRYQNDETGRMAYDPKILLKVVLLGYARGLISSRKMEQACRENVTFMALACGQRPDHSTIAAFVSSMQDEIVPLFRDFLLVCEESGLLGGTFFALDGCKLPSNAFQEWSGKISDLVRKKEKMEKRVTELLRRQVEVDKKDNEDGKVQGFNVGEEVHFLHIDPVPDFNLDEAHHIQNTKGLPQGVPADMKLFSQAALRGQPVTRLALLPQDQRLNLLDRILIEPDPSDGLQ